MRVENTERVVISSQNLGLTPSSCPELKEIKYLYPGQVIQFYVYVCSDTSVFMSSANIRLDPDIAQSYQTSYYATYFNEQIDKETKVILRGTQPAKTTTTPPQPAKFGIWPGLYPMNQEYTLRVTPTNTINAELTLKFTFIEPYAYVNLPVNCSSIAYNPESDTFGPQSSCKTQYAVSPMLDAEYGILSTIDPSYGNRGKEDVSNINYEFNIYPEEREVAINPLGLDDTNIGNIVKFSSVSKYNELVEYDASQESVFLANYMIHSCNFTDSTNVTQAGGYVLYPTQFNNYLMTRPILNKIQSNYTSEAFYVPVAGGLSTQYLNMSAVGQNDTENGLFKWLTKGVIRLVCPELSIISGAVTAIIAVDEIGRRDKALYVEAYIKPKNLANEGTDDTPSNWYICPDPDLGGDSPYTDDII